MSSPSQVDGAGQHKAVVVEVDSARLRTIASNSVIGVTLGVLYLGAVVIAVLCVAGVGYGVLRALTALDNVVLWIAGGAAAVAIVCFLWWFLFMLSAYLLDNTGLTLGPRATWLLFPIAPVVCAFLVPVHALAHIGARAPTRLRVALFVAGAVIACSVVVAVVLSS